MRWPWSRKSDTPRHLRAGVWGEQHAERLLRGKGYRLLGRRVRVGRHDEIDLVARNGEVLVFVEVKTRKDESFGRPFTAVNTAKRRRLSRAAIRYMARLRQKPPHFRFDVVEVIGAPEAGEPEMRHIENAFPIQGGYRVGW